MLGIHLSYWQKNWCDDLVPCIVKAQQAGFQIAEFPLIFPDDLDYQTLVSVLDDLDMRASCGTGLNPSNDISSDSATIRKAGFDHLRSCIEGAQKLKSPVLGGLTYAAWEVSPNEAKQNKRRHSIASLKEVDKIAGDHDVCLCLEVVNRFEGILINSVEEGLSFLEECDCKHIKLHLDTFHLNIEEKDISKAIVKAGDELGHFHVSENNRDLPGRGHIPWNQVRKSLEEINYRGYIVAETFVEANTEVGSGMNIWRTLEEEKDRSAKEAAVFLRRLFDGI
jgi:D-psicose/D-tagatose/L-ribulose 3-epimerase